MLLLPNNDIYILKYMCGVSLLLLLLLLSHQVNHILESIRGMLCCCCCCCHVLQVVYHVKPHLLSNKQKFRVKYATGWGQLYICRTVLDLTRPCSTLLDCARSLLVNSASLEVSEAIYILRVFTVVGAKQQYRFNVSLKKV